MNGLASSDPVSTPHGSDGGGDCFPALCTDPGAGASPACPFVGDGPSVQVRFDGRVLECGS